MNKRRLLAGCVLALALSPGTFLRTHIPLDPPSVLGIARVADLPAETVQGGFTREGVWELASTRLDFGGYSALLVLSDGTLRAFSDRGERLTFSPPGVAPQRKPSFTTVWDRGELSSYYPDIEAATRDPASGDYWLAFENEHSLIRYSVASELEALRRPPEWQGWSTNSGAEAMTRLPDGRFVVLPERGSTGLLYSSDPTTEVEPLTFTFAVPGGYQPTDMTALPDGRVLVLLRQLGWTLPPFASAIGIADPRALKAGETLDIELLVKLETILPRENYEALALAGVDEDGTVQLWLMSDDNLASIQRTLLVRLGWREAEPDSAHEKAREE